ncbi:clindamycin resistance transfer factor BtgB, partial [Bacteroides cellulosilyticus]
QVLEINQAPQRKKQLEEELDQPRKKSRGFGMVM